MRLLLDTNIVLFALAGDGRLPAAAAAAIREASALHVSAASIWEMSIKVSLGKLALDLDRMLAVLAATGVARLDITHAHARAVFDLPPIHRDPFDRMLVAQALCEPLRLLTADRALAAYGGIVLPV